MKYKEQHQKSKNWFVMWMVVVFLFVACIVLSSCQTCKGLAKDISWTASKIDQSIQPE